VTDRPGAIVLAGGRSSRFGRDKLETVIDGRPLLDHAVDAVRSIAQDIDVVVVAAPDGRPTVASGVRVVHDAIAFGGPLAGVATGMGALEPDVDRVVVVAGDMPGLVVAVLTGMLDLLDASIDAVLLEQDDEGRPLPSAYRRAPAELVVGRLRASGERRLRALPGALGAHVIPASMWRTWDPEGSSLRDIDAPEDVPSISPPQG
jgi:molybdenum cofactor guanylyltransferase